MIDFYAEAEKAGDTYYCGNRTLRALDRNGLPPKITMVSGNRTGGKTTYFTGMLLYEYLKNKDQFVVIVRNKNQLGTIVSGTLEAGRSVYFPDLILTEKKNDHYSEFIATIGDSQEVVGYGIPLKNPKAIKENSSNFYEVQRMFMDEFMADDEQYLNDEVGKLMNVHTSIARAPGQPVRYVPIYMASNATSIVNPYFQELDIVTKIQPNTKFYRGDGFIYERTLQEGIAARQRAEGLASVFKHNAYSSHSIDNTWLNDNITGIEKANSEWGDSIYQHTLYSNGNYFGVHYFPKVGIYYICSSHDSQNKNVRAIGTDDVTLSNMKNSWELKALLSFMLSGRVRYQNIMCKKAVSPILYV